MGACAGSTSPSAADAEGRVATVASPAIPEFPKGFPDSFWGTAPSAAIARTPEQWVPDMVSAGITTVRNFDSTVTVDRLRPITDAGMTATGILFWSPTSPGTLPVNDLGNWRRYVTDTVTRYKGRIRHWEVWNEPPNFTADKSPASYGAVVAVAYDAAKAVDPTVQIGLGTKSNHVNFLAQSIDAGARDKFDFITLHPYENANLIAQGMEGQFMSIVPRVRTMLMDKNPARQAVPVWFTEIGLQVATSSTKGVSEAEQADGLVKIFTMAAAQRAARVYWFSPRDAEGETLGLTTAGAVKRMSYTALKTLTTYLGPRPQSLGWIQPNGAYYGFLFTGPSGTVLSAWAPPGKSAVVSTTSPVLVIDPRSGAALQETNTVTLGNTPLLIVARADSLQAKAWKTAVAANDGKAFPWYGDHRAAKSVSLSATTGPDGIVMLKVPEITIVNGLAEFDLSGRNGATFTVDPEFLSYTSTPFRITATLRCHGTGDPGFNLKYESSAPLSKADGNGLIPSSDGWHRVNQTSFYEKSWTITDARFVGFYGYNFAFDTNGSNHSQISIQKVTIEKL